MAWEEIQGIECRNSAAVALGPSGMTAGIVLKVAGAKVVVEDVYEVPLTVVLEKIREHRRR